MAYCTECDATVPAYHFVEHSVWECTRPSLWEIAFDDGR